MIYTNNGKKGADQGWSYNSLSHVSSQSVSYSPCRELFPDNDRRSIHYPLHTCRWVSLGKANEGHLTLEYRVQWWVSTLQPVTNLCTLVHSVQPTAALGRGVRAPDHHSPVGRNVPQPMFPMSVLEKQNLFLNATFLKFKSETILWLKKHRDTCTVTPSNSDFPTRKHQFSFCSSQHHFQIKTTVSVQSVWAEWQYSSD